jgi:hypothetical protein
VNKRQEGGGGTQVNYNKKPINPIRNESLVQARSSETGVNIKGKRTMASVDGNEGECEWNSFFSSSSCRRIDFCSSLFRFV